MNGRKLWAEQTKLLAWLRHTSPGQKTKDWQTRIRQIGRELMQETV